MGRLTNPKDRYPDPPRWAEWFLSRFCPQGMEEELQGDLLEMYAYWGKTVGWQQARWRYAVAVLRLVRPFWRSNTNQLGSQTKPTTESIPLTLLHPAMLRNYLTIAWRNWRKQPGFTAVNVFGLAAGLTCCALIALWVEDELSYDRFQQHYERIARLTQSQKTETGTALSARTGAAVAGAVSGHYPEVEKTVRLRKHSEIVLHHNEQILQPDIVLTEPSFFDVFSYRLSRGNVTTALQDPYSVVLTESTAKKYFGNDDPMGQRLTIYMYDSTGRGATYTITGITPDPPRNAHFTFTMLGSLKTAEVAHPDLVTIKGWTDNRFYTYLLLKKGVDLGAFSIALVGEMCLQAIPLEFIIRVGIFSNGINKTLLYFLKAIQSGLLSNLPLAL